jgi:murein DD-endopeptidase
MEMRSWLRIALLGVVVVWPSTIWSEESRESFDIVVPQTPIPVVTEGQVMLVYELHLTNFAAEPLSVKRLRIHE